MSRFFTVNSADAQTFLTSTTHGQTQPETNTQTRCAGYRHALIIATLKKCQGSPSKQMTHDSLLITKPFLFPSLSFLYFRFFFHTLTHSLFFLSLGMVVRVHEKDKCVDEVERRVRKVRQACRHHHSTAPTTTTTITTLLPRTPFPFLLVLLLNHTVHSPLYPFFSSSLMSLHPLPFLLTSSFPFLFILYPSPPILLYLSHLLPTRYPP